ncbi:MAG: hypothetical protein IK001_08955, partial [Lachnospiraceae bacterium]|nr:hypothetical protein [Lachnospiraceae bacterium]
MNCNKFRILLGILITVCCIMAGCSKNVTGGADVSPTPVITATEAPKTTEVPGPTDAAGPMVTPGPDVTDTPTPEPAPDCEPTDTEEMEETEDTNEMENGSLSGAYDIGAMTLREKILQMCVITTEQLGNWN